MDVFDLLTLVLVLLDVLALPGGGRHRVRHVALGINGYVGAR